MADLLRLSHANSALQSADTEPDQNNGQNKLLAIVHAMKTWRVYLDGRHTRLITDHDSLQFFLSQKTLTSRQARWKEDLASFDFAIHYRLGKPNNVADALSRRPDFQLNTTTILTQSNEMPKALQKSA